MNDTTLQAYALEKGIEKSTTEMTNQEKIGLAMEMFMEKTAYAAGNYAKENETLAGSLGTAKSALSNFLSGAGSVEDVVSSFSNAANVIAKNITSMFPSLMSGITQLVDQLVPLIPPLLQQVLPGLIDGAVSLVNGLVAALPQIVSVIEQSVPSLIDGIVQIIITLLPALVQTLVAALQTLLPALIDGFLQLVTNICSNFAKIIQPLIDALPDIIINIVDALMTNLPLLVEGMVLLLLGIVDALPQIVQALVDALPQVIEMVIVGLFAAREALINGAIRLVGALVGALPQILSSLYLALPQAFIGIWNGVKSIFMQAPKWFADRFNAVVEGVARVFLGVKEALVKPFNYAMEKIQGVADKIKGFFSGEISMPKIKMPKFSVSPSGWKIGDLLKGEIPKLGIDWYAKAMENPIVMTKPTVFGYDQTTGQLMGGGEAGSEVVSGTNTLMNMIRGAVAEQNSALAYYLQRVIELLATYFPQVIEAAGHDIVTEDGAIVARYAPLFDVELGKIKSRKDRGR